MKKIFDCRGSLMLEALLSLLLISACLGCLAQCLTGFIQGYNTLLQKRELKAQMRLALSHMLYDLEKSNFLIITKKKECDKITFIKHTPSGTILEKATYEQDSQNVAMPRIYKEQQPITPGYSSCPIGIRFYCRPLSTSPNNQTYLLRLEGRTPALKNPLIIATAVRLNGFLENNGNE